MTVTCGVATITPEMAQGWLENHNGKNRKLRQKSTWQRYINDMVNGDWLLTGESIIFDEDGTLVNGQHRLHACVAANRNFDSVVVYGVDPTVAFLAIDQGIGRTSDDYLFITYHDHPDPAERLDKFEAKRLSSAAKAYMEIKRRSFGHKYSTAEVRDTLEAHPIAKELVKEFKDRFPTSDAVVLGCAMHFSELEDSEDDLYEFLTRLQTQEVESGIPLSYPNPVFALGLGLELRSREGRTMGSVNRLTIVTMINTAWNDCRDDKPVYEPYVMDYRAREMEFPLPH